jgi:hypothetical protein
MACVFPHSTDYDESDKLYLEELTLERGLDIYELISPERHALPYSAVLCYAVVTAALALCCVARLPQEKSVGIIVSNCAVRCSMKAAMRRAS